MKPTDILTEQVGPTICVYGPPMSAKTTLVSQASGGYLMDYDNGMLSAALVKDRFSPLRHQIEFDRYLDKKASNPIAFMKGKEKIINIANLVWKGKFDYDALIIDSLTGLCRACERMILHNTGHVRLSQPDWGMVVSELEQILNLLSTLPILVLVTAHEDVYQVGETTKIRPYASGQKIPNILPAFFDEIWHAQARPVGPDKFQYTIVGRGTNVRTARTRSGMVKPMVHASEPSLETDLGLKGLLKKMGHEYGKRKEEIKTSEVTTVK